MEMRQLVQRLLPTPRFESHRWQNIFARSTNCLGNTKNEKIRGHGKVHPEQRLVAVVGHPVVALPAEQLRQVGQVPVLPSLPEIRVCVKKNFRVLLFFAFNKS